MNVNASPLKQKAKGALERNLGPERFASLTVEDLIRLKPERLNIRSKAIIQLLDFLAPFGLRLGLNAEEVNVYRLNGRLTPITEDAEISVVGLSPETWVVLTRMNIVTVRDRRRTSLKELLHQPRIGDSRLREIKRAFELAGYPMYIDEAERACGERLAGDIEPRQNPD